MNRKVASLIKNFCKKTNKPYRQFKKAYYEMSDEERRKTKIELLNFKNYARTEQIR